MSHGAETSSLDEPSRRQMQASPRRHVRDEDVDPADGTDQMNQENPSTVSDACSNFLLKVNSDLLCTYQVIMLCIFLFV
jgi:hypothetical protein